MRIPVISGARIVALVCAEHAARIAAAPNAEAVRKRKTGRIVQINLKSHGDDSDLRSYGTVGSVYQEELLSKRAGLTVLAICNDLEGGLRRWDEKDRFAPRRFNPDLIPSTEVGSQRGRIL